VTPVRVRDFVAALFEGEEGSPMRRRSGSSCSSGFTRAAPDEIPADVAERLAEVRHAVISNFGQALAAAWRHQHVHDPPMDRGRHTEQVSREADVEAPVT
jgi:hypothetical protein